MALDVRGHSIYSWGEFAEMTRGLDAEAPHSGVLAAWFAGHHPSPDAVHRALTIDARFAAKTARSRDLIRLGVERLEAAFPGVGK